MPKKLTCDDVLTRIKNKFPNYELRQNYYVGNNVKMELFCKIHNRTFYKSLDMLMQGHGCPECSSVVTDWTIDKMQKALDGANINIEILDDVYISAKTKLHLRCKIDGYEWSTTWSAIQPPKNKNTKRKPTGCLKCAKRHQSERQAIPNECNMVSMIRPDLIKYFKNPDDANKFAINSNLSADMICPDCGYEKKRTVQALYKRGFCCPRCSDGKSVPEKMMREILNQLKIEYIQDSVTQWSEQYRYDFYIPSLNTIIETHGIQHYEHKIKKWEDVETVQKNDRLKYELAQRVGIQKYIVIECKKTTFDYLKNSFCESLSGIFDLSIIDWNKVESECNTSFMTKAWSLYKDNLSANEIATSLKLELSTIYKYLSRGYKLKIIEKRDHYKRRCG